MSFPGDLRYSKDHEWVEATAKPAKIGVTSYAVEQLGDIVHVELPSVGETFEAGAAFGTIESTKTVSDLYMPIGGKIIEVNQEAISKPETLQADPFKGWLVKIEPKSDTSSLLDATAYEKFIQEQE
jgi:glycine cleavage system H protein